MTFLSSCIGMNRIWSIKTVAQTFIVVKVIIIPFITIVLDMFYSDWNVILKLRGISRNYRNHTNSSDMTSDNGTAMNGETASIVLTSMLSMPLFVIVLSCIAFFFSNWLSSLLTSYKTSVSLMYEEMDLVSKLGSNFLLLD